MFNFMHNMNSYEDTLRDFSWKIAEEELGYKPGDVINIGEYCTDRICRLGKANKTAFIWQDHKGNVKTWTFDEMRIMTNSIAGYLQKLGIKNGDRVCLFMDKVPELYLGFLAGLKMGAIVQPLFSAFGSESLITRLEDAKTSAIITQKKHLPKVRNILKDMDYMKYIIIVDERDPSHLKEREHILDIDALEKLDKFDIFPSTAETPSVLHYTSGTTGLPKGAQHVHFSVISQYITTKYSLDLKDDDIYWCTADPGWVTGTSYGIIGPWANGATQCVLDAGFTADGWYSFIEKHRITVWYSAPTAIRALMKEGEEIIKKHDLSSLRYLASIGEPLNAEAVLWSDKVFGMMFHDTYWQTETGSMVISNYPCMKIKPGSMGKPFPGMEVGLVDINTHKYFDKKGVVGIISVKPGWPAMFRAYWNNKEKYESKFVDGWYLCGDRASIDEDGYYWFVGRDDDVINTAGHLVGPFEIESALLEHPAVAESAAVGKPDQINMEVVKAFIALKPGFEPNKMLELEIMNFIRKKLSPLAMPQEVEFVDKLPKTRSGKIMRRVLRAKEWGEEIGDISTLENDM
ncbi:MAG: acetyl-coenzyme A synthetase [Chlorobi bacterium OLB5]|nr:MAG: acetyl-coenzyme A synthetase [Chlorobi bacterium OLB5]